MKQVSFTALIQSDGTLAAGCDNRCQADVFDVGRLYVALAESANQQIDILAQRLPEHARARFLAGVATGRSAICPENLAADVTVIREGPRSEGANRGS